MNRYFSSESDCIQLRCEDRDWQQDSGLNNHLDVGQVDQDKPF